MKFLILLLESFFWYPFHLKPQLIIIKHFRVHTRITLLQAINAAH